MAWKSPSKKSRPSSADAAALQRLALVREQREPFAGLMSRLVTATLDEFLPPTGDVLEIGMGDGQLYRYLPESLRPRLIHSEPVAAASRSFRKLHPEARVLQASAEQLPFGDGELDAVLGLCVLDMVSDGNAVARELGRVLRPGGRVIHFLDMSTRLTALVDELSRSSFVPLPNVFFDPSASTWPEDLFVAPLAELGLVAEVLKRHGHALGQPLSAYLKAIRQPGPRAASELAQLQESAELRATLRTMFGAAFELAEPELRPRLAGFQGRPLSSARHFAQRLAGWFGPAAGFQVDLLDVRTASETGPETPGAVAYIGTCVGERRELDSLPEARLCPDAEMSIKNGVLRELGVLVLVARRERQPGPEK